MEHGQHNIQKHSQRYIILLFYSNIFIKSLVCRNAFVQNSKTFIQSQTINQNIIDNRIQE